MNSDGNEVDAIDVLIKIGIFACFAVFAVCLWLLKREKAKRKKKNPL